MNCETILASPGSSATPRCHKADVWLPHKKQDNSVLPARTGRGRVCADVVLPMCCRQRLDRLSERHHCCHWSRSAFPGVVHCSSGMVCAAAVACGWAAMQWPELSLICAVGLVQDCGAHHAAHVCRHYHLLLAAALRQVQIPRSRHGECSLAFSHQLRIAPPVSCVTVV